MIFVTLGTQKFQLNRLLEELDNCIENKVIKEEVYAQIGNSTYQPKYFESEKFMDKDVFDEYISKASLIITHSGVGSIITSLKKEKPVIVYPRLAKYNEHVDDHQLDIARAFEKKNFVICCYEEDNLETIISRSKGFKYKKYISQTDKMVNIISEYIKKV